jgi:hypothetical protein
MMIDEEVRDRVAQVLFETYGKDQELQAHRRRHWGQLSDIEIEDWRFDAMRVLWVLDPNLP